jgi:hypothetical protein
MSAYLRFKGTDRVPNEGANACGHCLGGATVAAARGNTAKKISSRNLVPTLRCRLGMKPSASGIRKLAMPNRGRAFDGRGPRPERLLLRRRGGRRWCRRCGWCGGGRWWGR